MADGPALRGVEFCQGQATGLNNFRGGIVSVPLSVMGGESKKQKGVGEFYLPQFLMAAMRVSAAVLRIFSDAKPAIFLIMLCGLQQQASGLNKQWQQI